jgi:hypothetical protein
MTLPRQSLAQLSAALLALAGCQQHHRHGHLRRANDVPGATPEQLRWHADAATRAPWTTLR